MSNDKVSRIKDYNNPKNYNSDICTECKGMCCKRSGCYFSPDDFKEISLEYLKLKIKEGYISIQQHRGGIFCSDTYILKIRDKGIPIVDDGYRDDFAYTPCILLGQEGCKLQQKDRPSGGKLYIPRKEKGNFRCYTYYTIDDCCDEWRPYQKILEELSRIFINYSI